MEKEKGGIQKFMNGFAYAFKGLSIAFKSEINIRFHIVAAIIVVLVGWYYHVSRSDWLWLVTAIGIVLIAEYLNTAIEKLTDIASPQRNDLAGKAKDISAAAVLIAAFTSAIIGAIIFWPYIFK